MTIDEMIAVLEAAKAGKAIECASANGNDWQPCTLQTLPGAWKMRVKLKPRRIWVPVYCDGYGVPKSSREYAARCVAEDSEIVEFVEVVR